MIIRPLDIDSLRDQFQNAAPFPHVVLEDFLEPGFALEVARSYPSFETASAQGHQFSFVNERKKVQITETRHFPEPVLRLNEALASPEFIAQLEQVTGIPKLLADERLAGGGIHVTGPHGRLDVHVDFNFYEERSWYRRLNLLLYLNPEWHDEWGGAVELWDTRVRTCHRSVKPLLNRCMVFQTSEISFHGVEPVSCPDDQRRCSFAAYYYTEDPPPDYPGRNHSTLFRPRPDEKFRGWIAMPAERMGRLLGQRLRRIGNRLTGRR